MNITIGMMKKVNATVKSGSFLAMRDLIDECGLDEGVLQTAVGDLDAKVKSMSGFFDAMHKYVAQLDNRLKMMKECYQAIQKLQADNELIEITPEIPDPPIIWRG